MTREEEHIEEIKNHIATYDLDATIQESLQWAIEQLEKPTPTLLPDKEIIAKFTYPLQKEGWRGSLNVVDEKQYEAAKWARDRMMEAFEPIVKEAYDEGWGNGYYVAYSEEQVPAIEASEYWEQLKERMKG